LESKIVLPIRIFASRVRSRPTGRGRRTRFPSSRSWPDS